MSAPAPLAGSLRGLSGLVLGARAVVTGLERLASEPALRRLALAPLALALLAQLALAYTAVARSDDLLALLWARPAAGLAALAWSLARVAVALALVLALFPLFRVLVDVLGGPFFDRLALHVLDARGVPVREPGLLSSALRDLVRSGLFAALGVTCALGSILPVVGPLALALGFAVGVAAQASSALNPALAVTGHGLRARLGFAFSHRAVAAGLGLASTLLLLVPVLGVLAIPGSIVGASELVARAHRESRLPVR